MDGDGLTVRIRDDGPGFGNPRLSAVIDGLADPERPLGLGVAIAQEIVKAYRGALKFQPHADGGLDVQISLPGGIVAGSFTDANLEAR